MVVLVATGLGVSTLRAFAQEAEVGFADRERVARFLDSNPNRAVSLLESVLTQSEADALESLMFPAPSDVDKVEGFRRMKIELRRLGLAEDDALVRAVDARISALGDAGN